MLKRTRQVKSLFTAISNKFNKMQRDHKNVKISPDVHQRLKIHAAQANMPIMDFADMLLNMAMSETEVWTRLRLEQLDKKKAANVTP